MCNIFVCICIWTYIENLWANIKTQLIIFIVAITGSYLSNSHSPSFLIREHWFCSGCCMPGSRWGVRAVSFSFTCSASAGRIQLLPGEWEIEEVCLRLWEAFSPQKIKMCMRKRVFLFLLLFFLLRKISFEK